MVSNINKLSFLISPARTETYLNYFSDECDINIRESQAYQLYIWNIKISAAFLEAICFYEVALRNAIIKALEPTYKVYSILNDNFIRALKPATRDELVKIVNKLSRNKQYEIIFQNQRLVPLRIDTQAIPPGKVIAELTLIFWENMLSKTHRMRWSTSFNKAFTNIVVADLDERNKIIDTIHDITGKIRDLRNRICHHEPIFNEKNIDLCKLFADMQTVLGYISEDAIPILEQFERVTSLLEFKPQK